MIVTAFHFVAATCIMSCIYAAEHKLFLDRVVKMILSFNWVIGFLLCCLSLVGQCQLRDSGIVVTPDRNQTIPFTSDENVTYSCSVDGGRTAIWEVRGRQIIGQAQASMFADSGFFVEGLGASTSVIRISGEARRNATLKDPPEINLLCVALEGLTGTPGRKYFIVTYDPPISPRGLDLVIIRSPTPTLRLVWERPLNVDPQVDIVYTVEINSTLPDGINYGPFENISQTYLPIDFPEALHSNRSCQMYWFFVSARNGAGPSLPSSYIETLPITTDVTNISQTLRVDSVDLQDGRRVQVTVSFKTLRPCSENFPIENYTININNLWEFPSSVLPPPGNTITQRISDSGIQRDTVYLLSVTACSNFSCKQSDPIPFSTSDLQSALVVFFENNIYLMCVLARNSPAQGCSIRLTLATNINGTQPDATFDLLRSTAMTNTDDVILSNCTVSANRKEAYDEERVVGVAIREDGVQASVAVPVTLSEEGSADNFTRVTNCTFPQQGGGDNRALTITLAVVLPILFILVTSALIATILFVSFYIRQKHKYKKRPSVTTDHVDDDTVVYDIRFRHDEITKLLKPEGSKVKRSSSAPVNGLLATTTGSTGAKKSPSTSSSSNSDEVFGDQGAAPRDGRAGRVPYIRSVSDNYKVIHNPYEVEMPDKRSLRLRFNRPGLRQYYAAKRSMSEGGSGSGLAGGGADSAYPHVSSRLKMSEEVQSLLSDSEDNIEPGNLGTVHEESEPTSPNEDAETESLLVPPGRSDSGNKSVHSLNSPGISFRANDSGGSVTGL